jgi:hypothetical protein
MRLYATPPAPPPLPPATPSVLPKKPTFLAGQAIPPEPPAPTTNMCMNLAKFGLGDHVPEDVILSIIRKVLP